MKKLAFLLALICIMTACLPLTASASAFRSILDVLTERSDEHRERLKNEELYLKNMYLDAEIQMNYSLIDDEPILLVFPFNWGHNGRLTLENRMKVESQIGELKYAAFGKESVYVVNVISSNVNKNYPDGAVFWSERFSTNLDETNKTIKLPPCLRDIMTGSAVQSFCGKICEIENVVMFDHRGGFDSITVYYETDKGTFVRCYPTRKDEANAEFTMEDYQKIEQELYDFAIENEGADITGGNFLDYAQSEYSDLVHKPKSFVSYKLYRTTIPVAGVFILAGGITAVVIIRKHKNRLAADHSVEPGKKE